MACIPVPDVDIPTLPFPLTIDPPELPSASFSADVCCKLLQFDLVPPPLPLGPLVLNPAAFAVIKTALKSIRDYIRALPKKCPLE